MGRVLVLETDSVFAAVLEDRLHVAGHQVVLLDEPARAIAAAGERQCDLVILAMELQVVPGIEVVRNLRSQPETSAVPILALSESNASGATGWENCQAYCSTARLILAIATTIFLDQPDSVDDGTAVLSSDTKAASVVFCRYRGATTSPNCAVSASFCGSELSTRRSSIPPLLSFDADRNRTLPIRKFGPLLTPSRNRDGDNENIAP